jgi:hypothetical protein
MKSCQRCKINKSLSDFSKNKRSKDSLSNLCKQCAKTYRDNYKNNKIEPPREKECSKCHLIKPYFEFQKKENSPDKISCWCLNCHNTYYKQYIINNSAKYEKYFKDYNRKKSEWFKSLKLKPCKDCNISYEPECMDFDHLKDKIKNVSRMFIENYSKEDVLKEIEKCDLVCVLCHNKRTYDRVIRTKFKYNRNINIINSAKNVPCAICNKKYESYNMQFDHIDPKLKYNNVCNLKSSKVDVLLNEISKCQILCALCHRRKSILEQREKWEND